MRRPTDESPHINLYCNIPPKPVATRFHNRAPGQLLGATASMAAGPGVSFERECSGKTDMKLILRIAERYADVELARLQAETEKAVAQRNEELSQKGLSSSSARLRIVTNIYVDEIRHHGVAAYIYEHGDSGCGDTNWPKTFIYLAGWGFGKATLNGEALYEDYQMHFMVTQGMRDRETMKVNYPLLNKKSQAGAVNPAAMQLDFYIRSPETDDQNNPPRKVFDHFFVMEVTWK